jgi:hypothetical protein
MCFKVNPWNLRSNALTKAKYLTSSSSHAMYSFFNWPTMTWESVFISSVLAPSAFALLSPSTRPSYSAMLFVALNSSLATYLVRRPNGASNTAEAPTPEWPQAPFVKIV